MHSLILDTVRDMVVEKFGEEAWKDLANKSSLPYTFETDAHFNDDLLYELLKHASEALKTSVDAILEQVGFWFIVFVKKSPEYANLLNMAGSSLVEIINNINSFHGHMKLSYFKNICPPTFRTTNVTATSLRLHYIPGKVNRKGLSSLVIGLVKGLAEVHLDLPANKLKIVLEKSAVKGADHDVFYISWRKLKEEKSINKQQAVCTIGLDGENLNCAFPFHFIVNKKLQFVQAGYALRKLIDIGTDTLLTSKFEIISPKIDSTFKSFQKNIGEPIILRLIYDDTTNVDIHGEFLIIKDKSPSANTNSILICFIGSPLFKSTQEVGNVGLCLSDFAVHDPAKDRLFAYDAESKSSARIKRIVSDNNYSNNNSESDDSSISIDFTDIYNGSNGSAGMNVTFDKKYSAHMLQSTSSCPIKSVMPKGTSETNLKSLSHVSPGASRVSSTPPPPSPSFITEKQTLIIDALLKDSWTKFELTKSLVEITIGDPDHKSFINTITDLFISLNRSSDLLSQSLRWELSSSNDANQMMRQDSVSSSILSAYSKRICSKVVKNLLQKLISDLHQLSKENLSEILNNQNSGAQLVEKIASKFLNDLCDSVSSWPSDFSKVLSAITQEASNAKGDEAMKFAHCTINSLLFLRLLSPAISFPDKFDIAPSAKLVEYQPILVLISKLINNLASGTQFDAGSPMSIYNSFISNENQLKIASFVNNLLDSRSKKSFSRHRPLSFALVDEFCTFLLMRIDRLFDHSFERPLIKTFMKEIATAQLRNV